MQLVSSSGSSQSVSVRYCKHGVRVVKKLSWAVYMFSSGTMHGLRLAAQYHDLSRLSDDALAKRGLARGDIARAVMFGVKTRR